MTPTAFMPFDDERVAGPAARARPGAVCHNAQVLRLPGPHFAIETRPTRCAEAIGGRIGTLLATKA